jgi:hypothetical protein
MLGGGRTNALTIEAQLARANEALLHQRWDSPRGDNVRDITTEALSRWPNDPQLLRLRTLACDDVVKAARVKRDKGDAGEALRLARLAYELDPSDDQAQRLVAELEAQAQAPPADLVPPLASARTTPSTAASPAPGPTRLAIDVSIASPTAGQSVDISARITAAPGGAPPKVDSETFRVSGPGVAPGTKLEAAEEGSGVFRTTFAFARPGRFEVAFSAHVDGATVRTSRTVAVGPPPAPAPLPASTGESAPPSPEPSAKWL